MKRKVLRVAGVVAAVSIAVVSLFAVLYFRLVGPNRTGDIIELGVPYAQQYSNVGEGGGSLIPWDMKLHDGKLYVSAGNYNDNTGPIGLCWYDTATAQWTKGGYSVLEEQIHTFCELDGVLTIPGTDAVIGFDWEYGSYYQLQNGEWEQYRVLPNARHCFDICRFEDSVFAAVGTDSGLSPLLISRDDGRNFEHVPLVLNGLTFSTAPYDTVRCYFLFEQQDELYALLLLAATGKSKAHLIARYDKATDQFVIIGNFNDITPNGTALGMRHTFFTEAVQWNGNAYFTNGKLVSLTDEKLTLTGALNGDIVWDLLVHGDSLYLLTSSGGEKKRICVYKTDNGSDFEQIFWFESELHAVSFERDDAYFYFGMADTLQPDTEGTGKIVAIPCK